MNTHAEAAEDNKSHNTNTISWIPLIWLPLFVLDNMCQKVKSIMLSNLIYFSGISTGFPYLNDRVTICY